MFVRTDSGPTRGADSVRLCSHHYVSDSVACTTCGASQTVVFLTTTMKDAGHMPWVKLAKPDAWAAQNESKQELGPSASTSWHTPFAAAWRRNGVVGTAAVAQFHPVHPKSHVHDRSAGSSVVPEHDPCPLHAPADNEPGQQPSGLYADHGTAVQLDRYPSE